MKEIESTYIINETMQNNIKRSMQYLIDNGVAILLDKELYPATRED